jgi:hypothetical protein
MNDNESQFPKRLFGILAIVVGVFVVLGGGCFFLLGTMLGGSDPIGILGLIVGVGLIVGGARMLRSGRK